MHGFIIIIIELAARYVYVTSYTLLWNKLYNPNHFFLLHILAMLSLAVGVVTLLTIQPHPAEGIRIAITS